MVRIERNMRREFFLLNHERLVIAQRKRKVLDKKMMQTTKISIVNCFLRDIEYRRDKFGIKLWEFESNFMRRSSPMLYFKVNRAAVLAL